MALFSKTRASKTTLAFLGFAPFLWQCQTASQRFAAPSHSKPRGPEALREALAMAPDLDAEATQVLHSLVPFAPRKPLNPFYIEPWVDNPAVQKWISYFTGKGRGWFTQQSQRGEAFRPLVELILDAKGLPTDLYYLAFIESGFQLRAHSTAQALGLWQFIPATGRRYGLRVDGFVDERQDPVRATLAAANYLGDLHRVFQSWTLTMAAYNSGEGRVLGAVMRKKSRNFWQLVSMGALPSETSNYVPKLIAAIWVDRNRQRYGFPSTSERAAPPLRALSVEAGQPLASLAQQALVSVQQLEAFNPHLLQAKTPPGPAPYCVWVPSSFPPKKPTLAEQKAQHAALDSGS